MCIIIMLDQFLKVGEVNLRNLSMQVIEDDPRYWEVMSSALSVGWLDIVVSKGYCISDIFLQYLMFHCK